MNLNKDGAPKNGSAVANISSNEEIASSTLPNKNTSNDINGLDKDLDNSFLTNGNAHSDNEGLEKSISSSFSSTETINSEIHDKGGKKDLGSFTSVDQNQTDFVGFIAGLKEDRIEKLFEFNPKLTLKGLAREKKQKKN
eukprot:TRINITY_DN2553_c0_g3_i1.p1 TRINITY_DN2553_c0_g3~~TRINITY_DN2553_c0_g3_i1.p1  ORF type:complete len:139 (+),score=24.53 TRINITY_DN2553_c0_g3_i1:721-1137(+)